MTEVSEAEAASEAKHKLRLDRWLPRIWAVAAVIVVFIVVYIAYLAFWPVKLISNTITISSPQTAGTPLVYTAHFCVYRDIEVQVSRTIVGVGHTQYAYSYTGTTGTAVTGCGTSKVMLQLSSAVQPGTYQLRLGVQAQVNPLHQVTNIIYSNTFTVKASNSPIP